MSRIRNHLLLVTTAGLFLTACESKKTPVTDSSSQTKPPHQKPAPVTQKPVAVDPAQDDPSGPKWLPGPKDVGGWLRTANVKMQFAGQWSDLGDELLTSSLDAFAIKSVAKTEFKHESGTVTADVRIIEAYHADDAFGIFTVLAQGPHSREVGSASRFATKDQRRSGVIWQGSYCIVLDGYGPQIKQLPQGSLKKLASALVKPIPSSEPPNLLSYLPPSHLKPGHVWVVRKQLNILPEHIQDKILAGTALEVTKKLNLSLDTLMAVAAFNVEDDNVDNYLFIVQYPTHADAVAVHKRYGADALIFDPAAVQPPSRFLVGTWTREQESQMHLIPEIVERLPQ